VKNYFRKQFLKLFNFHNTTKNATKQGYLAEGGGRHRGKHGI